MKNKLLIILFSIFNFSVLSLISMEDKPYFSSYDSEQSDERKRLCELVEHITHYRHEEAKNLLANYSTINVNRKVNGLTPLHWSILTKKFYCTNCDECKQHREKIRKLGKINTLGNDNYFCLHCCDYCKREKCNSNMQNENDSYCFIKLLLYKGADPSVLVYNKITKTEKTILHLAVHKNYSSVIKLLLGKNKSLLFIKDSEGFYPIMIALNKGLWSAFEVMIDYLDKKSLSHILHKCFSDRLEDALLIITNKYPLLAKEKLDEFSNNLPYSIILKNLSDLNMCLQNNRVGVKILGPKLSNNYNNTNETFFCLSILIGNFETIKSLCPNKLDVNSILKYLFNQLDFTIKNRTLVQLLNLAIQNNNFEIANFFCDTKIFKQFNFVKKRSSVGICLKKLKNDGDENKERLIKFLNKLLNGSVAKAQKKMLENISNQEQSLKVKQQLNTLIQGLFFQA